MRTSGSPTELERRRCLAIQALVRGYTVEEVGDFLGVDTRSVRRWREAFQERGMRDLAAAPVPGRPARLTHTQEKIVLRWVREPPSEHGFATELWSGRRVAQLIERELGLQFHSHYMSTWLRARGFTPQKPQRMARQANLKETAAWLATDWPRIRQKARREGVFLVFIDESGLLMAPLVRRTWAPRGQTPVLLQSGGRREKVSVAAALWLPPRQDGLGFCFQTLVNHYFDNQYVALFVEMLVQELDGPVLILWDSGPMHKGNPIRQVLEEWTERLTLEKLPPYAPQLNPVEPVWSWVKYGRLCNFAPQNAFQLNQRVVAELKMAQHDQNLLKGFFGGSDIPLPRTLLS